MSKITMKAKGRDEVLDYLNKIENPCEYLLNVIYKIETGEGDRFVWIKHGIFVIRGAEGECATGTVA